LYTINKILNNIITVDELKKIAADTFGDLIKAVVDVDRELIAIDAELHSDLEALFFREWFKNRAVFGVSTFTLILKMMISLSLIR